MQESSQFYTHFAKSTLQNKQYLQIFSTLYCIVLKNNIPLQRFSNTREQKTIFLAQILPRNKKNINLKNIYSNEKDFNTYCDFSDLISCMC